MTLSSARPGRFRYEDYELDGAQSLLLLRYSLGEWQFQERVRFEPGGDWSAPAVDAAARLVFLLAGVSYFKTGAPAVVDLGALATTAAERDFLRAFYLGGLAEFAYHSRLDLGPLEFEGPTAASWTTAPYHPPAGRPLVPFGGGIDSIVTAEQVHQRFSDTALLVVSRPGDRFAAIERPAARTGLPVVRAEREIDPQLLRSGELGFLNGHVPVTGILSAIATLAAVLAGRDAVVMANEWSASIGSMTEDGRSINHQYSKSAEFEELFSAVLRVNLGDGLRYFSLLRPYSELWVAKRFAALPRYHSVFRSCNRSFTIDRNERLDNWCGQCDKCCFIDLVLSPFLDAVELGKIFDGREPLTNQALAGQFRTLLGLTEEAKPFECVGDVEECRAAVLLARARPDRTESRLLQSLAGEVLDRTPIAEPERLLAPLGQHAIPDEYAPQDQLV